MNDKWTYKWSQCDMNYFHRYNFFVILKHIVIVIIVWWWLRWILDNEENIKCIRSLVFNMSIKCSIQNFLNWHSCLLIQLFYNYLILQFTKFSIHCNSILNKYCYDALTLLVRYETTSRIMMTTEILNNIDRLYPNIIHLTNFKLIKHELME